MEISKKERLQQIINVLKENKILEGLTPEKLRIILESLGPTFIKIGQIMASRNDLLKEDYCDELAKLRNKVKPMNYNEVELILKEEYLEKYDEIFSSIDEHPIGSASIAQVHSATLKNGDDRKYINSKESELFKKNLLLYNYHRAHEKLNKEDSIIIMEGFFDVIRADTVGVTNCVATMGTALTKQHISILKKITNNIILCFDGDEAGEKATIRAIPILEESGIVPKIIRLEEKDPDEYIIKRGAEAFKNKVENPISVLEFKMKILKSNKDMQNIEDITAYLEETLKEISKINNEIEIELNLKKLSQEYNVEYLTLKNKVIAFRKKLVQVPQKANQIKVVKKESKYIQAINNLIFYMLKDSQVIKEAEEKVVYIENKEKKLLFNEIIYYYHKYESFNIADFFTHLSNNELLLGQCEKITSMDLKENYSIEEIEDYIKVINEEVKQTKIKKLENDLKNEIDPLVQLKILNEIANIKGVNNYDRSN